MAGGGRTGAVQSGAGRSLIKKSNVLRLCAAAVLPGQARNQQSHFSLRTKKYWEISVFTFNKYQTFLSANVFKIVLK